MILDAKSGLRGVLVNAETGARIPYARWANIPDDGQPGEFEALAVNVAGEVIRPPRVYRGRCRLKFIQSQAPSVEPPTTGHSPRTVRRRGVPVLISPDRPCEHRTCWRPAEWLVSEEQEEPPHVANGKRYETARMVAAHYYCSWHYREPTLHRLDGEIQRIEVAARPG